MARHLQDPYVKQAAAGMYRSRGAFKLLQLQQQHRLLRPGHRVVDLGAAPGGWSQVAARIVGPQGTVLAIDRLPMEPIEGVTFIQGGIEGVKASLRCPSQIDAILSYASFWVKRPASTPFCFALLVTWRQI